MKSPSIAAPLLSGPCCLLLSCCLLLKFVVVVLLPPCCLLAPLLVAAGALLRALCGAVLFSCSESVFLSCSECVLLELTELAKPVEMACLRCNTADSCTAAQIRRALSVLSTKQTDACITDNNNLRRCKQQHCQRQQYWQLAALMTAIAG